MQDVCSLTEAACAGQKPEQVGPVEVECGGRGSSGSHRSSWDGCQSPGGRGW